MKDQYDRAVSDYDQAITLNPQDANAYYNKALACEKAGRTGEAINAYRQFIANAPPQYAQYIEKAKQCVATLGG
jgi:tetratricopeptide (TPR) repeat protein